MTTESANLEFQYNNRVKVAAKWLDEYYPGWYHQIDITELDLSSPEKCICGQLTLDWNTIATRIRTDKNVNTAAIFSATWFERYWINEINFRRLY
jgi:hypothetical protein